MVALTVPEGEREDEGEAGEGIYYRGKLVFFYILIPGLLF